VFVLALLKAMREAPPEQAIRTLSGVCYSLTCSNQTKKATSFVFRQLEAYVLQSTRKRQRTEGLRLSNCVLSFLLDSLDLGDLLSFYGQQLMAQHRSGHSFLHSDFQQATHAQLLTRDVSHSNWNSLMPDSFHEQDQDQWMMLMEENPAKNQFNMLVLADKV